MDFQTVTAHEVRDVLPGTILFLPPKEKIGKNASTDPGLQIGAFNHPAIVISCPESKKMEITSKMTSFHNTPIRAHLRAKGISLSTGTAAAKKGGYLRVVTASKPYAKDCLKLRNGMGMKRDSSYVGVKRTYVVSMGALARYGRKEGVGEYRLTAHSLGVLGEELGRWRTKMKKKKNLGGMEGKDGVGTMKKRWSVVENPAAKLKKSQRLVKKEVNEEKEYELVLRKKEKGFENPTPSIEKADQQLSFLKL